MTRKEHIRQKIEGALDVVRLEVVDDSARHAGHAGARPEGETHFQVLVISPEFAGLSRLERQRRINDILKEELEGAIHALSIKALTPDEAAQKRD